MSGLNKVQIAFWNKVDNLLIAGANGVQVSSTMLISIEELYKRCMEERGMEFCTLLALKFEEGNTMLFAKQFDLAMNDNVAMLEFLGKQRLGQVSNKEVRKHFNQTLLSSSNENIQDVN